jgi:hypothetical protein
VVKVIERLVQATVTPSHPSRVQEHSGQQPAGQSRNLESEAWLEGGQAADGAAGKREQHVEEAAFGAQVDTGGGQDILVTQGVVGRQGILPVNTIGNDVV